MKCDKLKAEPMIINDDYTALYYPKDSVDAAIAELKAKLEDVQATAYAESVDAGRRNRYYELSEKCLKKAEEYK